MHGCEPGRRRYRGRRLAVLLLVLAAGLPTLASEPPFSAHPLTGGELPALGARVDELLELGRRLNPGLKVRALEAEAALARVDAAGRFPDPMFTTEFEDIRASGSYAPESLGRVKYTVAQTIPLWGKRGLERGIASAEAGAAEAQRRLAEVELDARIKVVFASYYAAHATIGVTKELLRTVAAIAEAAQSRYAQGRGNQQDAISAEAEKGRLQHDLARQEGERRGATGRLNALLDRPPGALLAPPEALRPVPAADAMPLAELLDRAWRSNSRIDAEGSEITAAERSLELVRRTWYPDVTLGLSVYDEDGADSRPFGGYEAMISLAIPLQWGLREARERDAKAKLAVSQARRESTFVDLRGQIEESWWALDGLRHGVDILRRVNIPQAGVMLRSTLAAYELGRADLPSVLLAEQAVRRTELDNINLLVEQQVRLAEIERLIGGDL
jgi:outer membrane protein, heavy metal efflux system